MSFIHSFIVLKEKKVKIIQAGLITQTKLYFFLSPLFSMTYSIKNRKRFINPKTEATRNKKKKKKILK